MPITVKHSKVSTIPDAGDSDLVRPSDWNADHTLTGLGTMAEQNANNVNITGGTITGVSGLGDVVGPASATDNAISRFDGTTGKLIQNSLATVSDTGAISAPVDASISGLTVGKGAGAVASNTAVGFQSLQSNTSGAFNTSVGYNSSVYNTSGVYNTANGYVALFSNSTGNSNSAFGFGSLYSNTTATGNTAVGYYSLFNNTTGNYNTGIGLEALINNTTASSNTAVGYQALYSNTTATLNVAIGYQAALYNTTGAGIVAIGANVLQSNTTGVGNTAIGTGIVAVTNPAMVTNTTGSYNVAIGSSALQANTSASNNTAVGFQAGYSNTVGAGCTYLGNQSGYLATGNYNTLIGYSTGSGLTTGVNNTFVGQGSGYTITTGSKNSILGFYSGNQGGLDIRTASNNIVLSDGDGNPRSFCNGTQWYFGNQTAIEYFPVTSSVSGRNAVTIDRNSGYIGVTSSDASPMYINRNTSDGDLVRFYESGTQEGSISVSGSTVSYNGGHLARWSQLPDNSKDDTILKGTVLTNLDDMCVWTKDGTVLANEQLNKMKVSDVEGDTNVAGVFVNWTKDEDCNSDDMNIAMTGDMIIRIADGVVVQKGDLLMSAGDGTAKPQGDDIVRSKTVAKVTSNHVTCTYADGSYCVPCVLMAC